MNGGVVPLARPGMITEGENSLICAKCRTEEGISLENRLQTTDSTWLPKSHMAGDVHHRDLAPVAYPCGA